MKIINVIINLLLLPVMILILLTKRGREVLKITLFNSELERSSNLDYDVLIKKYSKLHHIMTKSQMIEIENKLEELK